MPEHDPDDFLRGSEWDRMSKGQRWAAIIFLICVVLWGVPVYESMLEISLYSSIVMPIAGVVGLVAGLYSGIIFMIFK